MSIRSTQRYRWSTCHYQMGGIPTNVHSKVVMPNDTEEARKSRQGSVCGGRVRMRLGARRQSPRHQFTARPAGVPANRPTIDDLKTESAFKELPKDAGEEAMSAWPLDGATSGESVAPGRRRYAPHHAVALRRVPVSDSMAEGVKKILEVAERAKHLCIKDDKVFNTARLEALELGNLVETSGVDHEIRPRRAPSPRPMSRSDYRDRDGAKLAGALYGLQGGNRLDYKPVKLKPLSCFMHSNPKVWVKSEW